jgi:hypothetical protein
MVNLIIHRSVLRDVRVVSAPGRSGGVGRRQITAAPQELFLHKH